MDNVSVLQRVLIANRGEIAVRIIKTCKKLGISSVVVYTEPDATSVAVKMADLAVPIGAPTNYLNQELIIEAAKKTGSQAVHPENAEFAKRVEDAGLIWIGPSSYSISAMGSKIGAKNLLSQPQFLGKIPLIPGYQGENQDDEVLVREAKSIGYPVLLKASAGGGGKGMRVVRNDADLLPEIQSARREAKEAFGDGKLLIEKYFDSVRHVEIQIMADRYNHVMHLFERDCSVQRRHQKVIEETPSPALEIHQQLREKMGNAAIEIGKVIKYRSAGTVEFILDDANNFYFLEVNTRLQVEHPITEAITGLDLVELQIRVAEGHSLASLGLTGSFPGHKEGHAIQCRLYAEDPSNNFLPSPGKLVYFIPAEIPHVRYDSGVTSGSDIPLYYDPMIAKVIAWGRNRTEAIQRMKQALRQTIIIGKLQTNQRFLLQLLEHPHFIAGNYNTHFIQNHLPPESRVNYVSTVNMPSSTGNVFSEEVSIVAMISCWAINVSHQQLQKHVTPNFRNLRYRPEFKTFRFNDSDFKVEYSIDRQSKQGQPSYTYLFSVNIGTTKYSVFLDDIPRVTETTLQNEKHYQTAFSCAINGARSEWRVFQIGEENIHVQSGIYGVMQHVKLLPRLVLKFKDETQKIDHVCRAQMTGKVVKVLAEAGKSYNKGDVLVIMESMKMESKMTAQKDVVVESINVQAGQVVEGGQPLLVFVKEQSKSQ